MLNPVIVSRLRAEVWLSWRPSPSLLLGSSWLLRERRLSVRRAATRRLHQRVSSRVSAVHRRVSSELPADYTALISRFFFFSSLKDDQRQYDRIGKQLEKTKKRSEKAKNRHRVVRPLVSKYEGRSISKVKSSVFRSIFGVVTCY